MKTIKAKQNIYGNWGIFQGSTRVYECGEQFDAVAKVSDMLETGDYQLSPKSEITDAQVAAHRERLKDFARRP